MGLGCSTALGRSRALRLPGVPVVGLALFALAATACRATTSSDRAPEAREKPAHRALLVGCTQYPYLEEKWWLEGPANDIALFEEVLTHERFGVDPSGITRLVGWPDDEKSRPTRRNITDAFRRLADEVGPGDQVIIVLAGHGSQQPAGPGSEDEEPDGLDEIFLPADVRSWNGEKRSVENAITDDEIKAWLSAIRSKNASVWFIADSCHSGTLTRGAPLEQERQRRLPSEVLIPTKVLAKARAGKVRSTSTPDASILGLAESAGNLVAMYAAQSHELTPELPLPQHTGEPHGLFSYVLAEVLSGSSSVPTYRELAEGVARQYRVMGRFHPTPILEGSGLDREVLGVEEWPARPRILLRDRDRASGLYHLKAGDLHGLRPGSVLSVYPPAGSKDADKLVGHVRVVRVEPLDSLVEPHEYDGIAAPKPAALRSDSRCSIVYVDYGEMRLRVALQSSSPVLETALDQIESAPGNLVRSVSDPRQADWFVRIVGREVCLIPGSGWMRSERNADESNVRSVPARYVVGSLDEPDAIASSLLTALKRVARARHLLNLARTSPTSSPSGVGLGLSLEFLIEKDEALEPLPYGTIGRILHKGDRVAFRVTNQGTVALDLTLLFVDSGSGIQAVFPRADDRRLNRIQPGETLQSDTATVADDTVGPEQVVAIGVRATGTPVDFAYLEQPTLPKTRSLRGRASPLEQLLASALYGEGNVRGLRLSDAEDYVIEFVGWEVVRAGK